MQDHLPSEATPEPAPNPAPSALVAALGYGGLLPFALLALGVCWPGGEGRAFYGFVLLAYGATIASFLGAIHWGLTMRDSQVQSTRLLVWGVIPSLVAWVALLLPAAHGMLLIAALLWACFAVDRVVYTRAGLRAWLPMRLLLTAIASLSCIASAIVLTHATP